jgi:FkbM family methyltransferase
MPKFPFGQHRIIDDLKRALDEIEKTWPMTGSYERIDPYIIPFLRGRERFELIIYHIESKLWYDNYQTSFIMDTIADQALITPGDVAFDLGSNAGSVTLLMAKHCGPDGHVHAFDPYPWNAAATQANARFNYLDNVTAHPVGLSNRSCKINVRPNDSRSYESSDDVNSQTLDIRAINDFMHLKPAFLKFDIEGAEYDVFDGQSPETFASVRTFVLEFHPMWLRPRGLDPKDALRSMEAAGFTLHRRTLQQPVYVVDEYVDKDMLFWGKRRLPPEQPPA